MSFIKTPTKGMRDILPKSMELREYVLSVMKDVYRTFGFELIQTPIVEHIENLSTNQGGENEKLIFKIMKRGEKLQLNGEIDSLVDSALRYDLTVPLSRFYANNMSQMPYPFRSLQMGNVYRAERSQKGRFREFMQCDLDILGEKSNLAEIELMTAVITFLKKLDFHDFTIKINDRRILISSLQKSLMPVELFEDILISLDKLDKIGIDGVSSELMDLGIPADKVNNFLNYFNKDNITLEYFCDAFDIDQEIQDNICEIITVVKNLTNANLVFDPTLVRGMGYYTGPIFEICVDDLTSSIGGGGRYDKMIEKYVNQEVCACGFSIGFERLLLLLEERGFQVPLEFRKIAYVITKECNLSDLFLEVQKKRCDGNIVKVLYRSKNYKFQRENLEKENYVVIEW